MPIRPFDHCCAAAQVSVSWASTPSRSQAVNVPSDSYRPRTSTTTAAYPRCANQTPHATKRSRVDSYGVHWTIVGSGPPESGR